MERLLSNSTGPTPVIFRSYFGLNVRKMSARALDSSAVWSSGWGVLDQLIPDLRWSINMSIFCSTFFSRSPFTGISRKHDNWYKAWRRELRAPSHMVWIKAPAPAPKSVKSHLLPALWTVTGTVSVVNRGKGCPKPFARTEDPNKTVDRWGSYEEIGYAFVCICLCSSSCHVSRARLRRNPIRNSTRLSWGGWCFLVFFSPSRSPLISLVVTPCSALAAVLFCPPFKHHLQETNAFHVERRGRKGTSRWLNGENKVRINRKKVVAIEGHKKKMGKTMTLESDWLKQETHL